MKKMKVTRSQFLFLVVLAVVMILPVFAKNSYFISTMITTFVFAALGVAWNIIGGYGGQISWCHSAFVAIGAYTAFIFYNRFSIAPFLMVPVGCGISYLMATGIGYGTFKLRGPFFSLSTIAFAEVIRILLLYFKDVTNGANGLYISYEKSNLLALTFANDMPFYYIFIVVLLVVVLVAYLFERSKTGHYLSAIKGDEDAATSLGIESFKVKVLAFQLSAVLASMVGTFYAFFLTYIDPTTVCGVDTSVKIGFMAIVGGLGTLWGPVLGAFVLIPFINIVNLFLGEVGGAGQFAYGIILIVIVIFKPKGLISFFKGRTKKAPEKKVPMKGCEAK